MSISSQLVSAILEKMKAIVTEKAPSALSYPKAFDFIKGQMEQLACPGMTFAWAAGPLINDVIPLGIDLDSNKLVDAFLNCSSLDVFHVITITGTGAGSFSINQVTRDQYAALKITKVKYTSERTGLHQPTPRSTSFWLLKDGNRVGHINVENVGRNARGHIVHNYTITPVSGIGEVDTYALKRWAFRTAEVDCGTLFCVGEISWNPAVNILAKAA